MKLRKMPENFWRLRRDPANLRKRDATVETQVYALDISGSVVFAGVYWLDSIGQRDSLRIAAHWRRWRKWYDALPWNAREDYPAKHSRAVCRLCLFPVREPRNQQWFPV